MNVFGIDATSTTTIKATATITQQVEPLDALAKSMDSTESYGKSHGKPSMLSTL